MEIVDALLDPKTYKENIKKVRLIQTHTSWVFLTGRYAYKIKKPVNFGFLNYTTLKKRKYFCLRELELNKKLSPDIYLNVVPVVEKDNKVTLGDSGKVLDYAVKMVELPQSRIMTNLLKKKKISYTTVDEIARIVADFHSKTPSADKKYGSLRIIKYNWDENFFQTKDFKDELVTKFDLIKCDIDRFMKKKKDIFKERIEKNKIRECHGDLHSGNIFITDKVHIFDCIEFNPRFSCSDTTSEIAFFTMDLDFYHRKDLSDFFTEKYIQYSKDEYLLSLLDFYKCYRAYVRGKVTSFKLLDPHIDRSEKEEAKKTAKSYFNLSYLYSKSFFEKPKLIAMMGLPGVGKTYVANRLGAELNCFNLKTDVIRKDIAGIPVEEHIQCSFRKGIYSKNASFDTYTEMFKKAEKYLRYGKSCILDATFAKKDMLQKVVELADRLNLECRVIHCKCSDEVVLNRLKKRKKEIDASDATEEIYYKMKKISEPPEIPVIEIDTSQEIGKIIKKIIRCI